MQNLKATFQTATNNPAATKCGDKGSRVFLKRTQRHVTIRTILRFKLKSYKISVSYNGHFLWCILLKFYTKHGSMTAALCVKFQKNSSTEKDYQDSGEDFAWFRSNLRRIIYIAMGPGHTIYTGSGYRKEVICRLSFSVSYWTSKAPLYCINNTHSLAKKTVNVGISFSCFPRTSETILLIHPWV